MPICNANFKGLMICNGKNIDNDSFDILDLIYVSVSDLCRNVQAAILHNKICNLLNVESSTTLTFTETNGKVFMISVSHL